MAGRGRIAVVLIHGIGEPRPMAAIRSFVDAIAVDDDNAKIGSWSKPDADADLYDLRYISMAGSRTRPVVDFYEFYWAHLLQGTTPAQLFRWAWDIVSRKLVTVPKSLRWVYVAGRILIGLAILTVALAIWWLLPNSDVPGWLPLVSAVVTGVFGVVGYPFIGTLGDPARYLDTRPDNVQARNEIQKAGVRLIERLHEARRGYTRIIVVGHSLGSMIGYDVLQRAWFRTSKQFTDSGERKRSAIVALWEAVKAGITDPVAYRKLQSAAHAEHIANGGHWRVTDFITCGSPLTYAQLLMALSEEDLKRQKDGRELVTCPPTPDIKFGMTRDLRASTPEGKLRRVRTPDHAGVFAFARWTNLFAPSRLVFDGDFLSGPLAEVFGAGIRDVEVTATHTTYWQGRPEAGAKNPLRALVEAMDLTGRDDPHQPAPGIEITPPAEPDP